MPKPSEVVLELGTPPPGSPSRTSEEFEQVPYPANTTSTETHWGPSRNVAEEELPLHYMDGDRARRRVRPSTGVSHDDGGRRYDAEYDDDKELYHDKLRPVNIPRIGRSTQRSIPPTNLVRSILHICLRHCHLIFDIDRVHSAEFGAHHASHIYTSVLLDALLRDWQGN
jgi:dolichyl-phosphate-mannose-protein mannosyltransferase